MPSPFPGMDPYLESPAHWSDFHAHFVTAITNEINDLLPDEYVAKMNEHVMMISPVVWDEPDERAYVPDVSVMSKNAPAIDLTSESQAVALAESSEAAVGPVVLDNVKWLDDYVETYVEIVRLPQRHVIAVLELLSPTNKYGEGRGIYMKKRRDFLGQPIHIVELDLLRAGARLEFDRPIPAGHYHAFVSPANERPRTMVYSWSVRDRLPVIPIPLARPEVPLQLDLARPFTAAYDNGRYKKVVNYDAPPPPPAFNDSNAEWVASVAKSAVKQSS